MALISTEVQLLLDQGVEARNYGDGQQARSKFEAALSLARQKGEKVGEANALYELGGVAKLFDHDSKNSRRLFRKSLDLFLKLGLEQGQAYALNALGSLEMEDGSIPEALHLLDKALALFVRTLDKTGQAVVLNQIGLIEKRSGNYEAAEQHWKQSLALFEELGDRLSLSTVLINLAGVEVFYRNDLLQAEALLTQALHISDEAGLVQEAEQARRNLAIVRNRMVSSSE